jgi:menaquinone-dependent protoporphyrinogen oxidase
MATTLLLYSSVYGLSRRICERVAARLTAHGEDVHLAALTEAALTDPASPKAGVTRSTVDPAAYDAIVIGASIKHGKHHPTVLPFLRAQQKVLESRPSALFSVNLVARKPGKNTPQTNPYLQALLAQSPWRPKLLGVFAGELDYARYSALDKQLMRFVMWINRGPTDPSTKVTFTDWNEVDRFAAQVLELVRGTAPAATANASQPAQATPLALA